MSSDAIKLARIERDTLIAGKVMDAFGSALKNPLVTVIGGVVAINYLRTYPRGAPILSWVQAEILSTAIVSLPFVQSLSQSISLADVVKLVK
jgi:hypothetical protein